MIVLHIGLPKTGTTFLQHAIFRRTRGVRFIHRGKGSEAAKVCADLRAYARAGEADAAPVRARITDHLRAVAATASAPVVMVSDEKISVDSSGFWEGLGVAPADLARRLGELRGELAPELPLRVIIGVRRQDRWLASRYAESSKAFPDFDQADFDRRMAAVGDLPTLAGPWAWLDFDAMRRQFAAALCAENLLLVPMERLMRKPREVLHELGAFLGGVDFVSTYDEIENDRSKRIRNKLSVGDDEWVLRRDDSRLRLSRDLQRRVLERFSESNAALAAAVQLDFDL